MILKPDPKLTLIPLALEYQGHQSISSLEFDPQSRKIFILANAVGDVAMNGGTTTLWIFDPDSSDSKGLTFVKPLDLSNKKGAKGEGLVVAKDHLQVFSDVKYFGHQARIDYPRLKFPAR